MSRENRQFRSGKAQVRPGADPPVGRVLLVDDNPSIRTMIALYLRSLRYQVVEAANADDAVRQAANAPFDLILMDQNLPGMDGLEATRLIRGLNGGASSVPIIGITAAGHDVRRQSCLDAGMNDVADKVGLLPAIPEILRRFVTSAPVDAARRAGSSNAEAVTEDGKLDLVELNRRIELIGRDDMARAFAGFSADGRRHLVELGLEWRRGRRESVASITHHLSGGAATFQMIGLHAILRRLETVLRTPAVDEGAVSSTLDQLTRAWSQSTASFQRWLDSKS